MTKAYSSDKNPGTVEWRIGSSVPTLIIIIGGALDEVGEEAEGGERRGCGGPVGVADEGDWGGGGHDGGDNGRDGGDAHNALPQLFQDRNVEN